MATVGQTVREPLEIASLTPYISAKNANANGVTSPVVFATHKESKTSGAHRRGDDRDVAPGCLNRG
jgi:hypothetical protein